MRPLPLLLIATLAVASPAAAKPRSKPSAEASAAPAAPAETVRSLDVPDAELPKLPELAPLRKVEPNAASTQALEALLERLVSDRKETREAALKDLDKIGSDKESKADRLGSDPEKELDWVPAIVARIQTIRGSLDRDRAPAILDEARRTARKGLSKKDLQDDEKTDWLEFVLRKPMPKEAAWRDLTHLLGMIRILANVGTTPAVRELLELRANFGEFLRKDLSRQIERLGDKAVPALIEGQKHDATVVRELAKLELDRLGKITPGEIVSMRDPEVLADTLRAFGRIRNEDAVDVCLSFANHDRKKVRDAAREAIAAIGDAGRWRLRDAYQDLTGEKVDKSIAWDILAKRIFALYDKTRVAELWGIFTSGLDAQKAGQYAVAVEAFDKVLAREPLFERRKEMAKAYFEVAKTISFDKAEDRLAMLRKARRLDPSAADLKRLDAEIAYTEGKALIAEGRPDRFLIERAVDLDPDHAEARTLLASFDERAVEDPAAPSAPKPRYGIAGAVAGATVLIMAIVAALLFRRKKQPPAPPGSPPPSPSNPPPEKQDAAATA